ncbi:hypothetical protein J5N97_001299 [Dioscorea zingiberensis]|uniref:Uncharacterized protein n=1 Tax=Dioscorea zingiberensis TaxID=325984 RepID=A0A9D5H2D6_9LILI|nr:hypothetical protein J5N97_001299 [Dioscorea zingiberensis]
MGRKKEKEHMHVPREKKKKAVKKPPATPIIPVLRPSMNDKPVKTKDKERPPQKKRKIWLPQYTKDDGRMLGEEAHAWLTKGDALLLGQQVDTSSFKHVVQMLTSSVETTAKHAANPKNPPLIPSSSIAAATKRPGPKKPAFKLYKHRSSMKNLKMISPLGPTFLHPGSISPITAFSPPQAVGDPLPENAPLPLSRPLPCDSLDLGPFQPHPCSS